jgi:hypothetical protein
MALSGHCALWGNTVGPNAYFKIALDPKDKHRRLSDEQEKDPE